MARQAGMTLIELTVVLLVLIGLAGLMIPYVGGFVSKTHDSANSDSLAAVNGAIQRYDVQFMGQPSDYDSLMDSDLINGTGYTKLMGGAIEAAGGGADESYLKTVTIDGKVLTNVGINKLMVMDNGTSDATFKATSGSLPVVKGTDYKLAALNVAASCSSAAPMGCIKTDADLSAILGHPVNTTANDYLALGVGQDTGMVGKTISEAPVHFAKTGAMSAANKYNRILAIYEVPNNTTVTNQGYCTNYQSTTGTVDASQPATMMLCSGTTAVTNVGAIGTIGDWHMVMMPVAKFVTTAMPMMKLEGLGGALASHYASMDAN